MDFRSIEVGDLLRFSTKSELSVVRVDEVGKHHVYVESNNPARDPIEYDEWELAPIELTVPILELNGFYSMTNGLGFKHDEEQVILGKRLNSFFFDITDVKNIETVLIRENHSYKIVYHVEAGIKTVDALQRAFRACKLYSLADNFKVK